LYFKIPLPGSESVVSVEKLYLTPPATPEVPLLPELPLDPLLPDEPLDPLLPEPPPPFCFFNIPPSITRKSVAVVVETGNSLKFKLLDAS
jgi:hypothetical protein